MHILATFNCQITREKGIVDFVASQKCVDVVVDIGWFETWEQQLPVTCSLCSYRSSCGTKVVHAANRKGGPSDKLCEIADSPVRFEFDVWRHFVFPVSRNKQEGKGDIHKTIQRHYRTTTNALWHFFAHIVRFQVHLLIHKRRLFFKS